MSTLAKAYSIENLRRAYRWVLSNPDPKYKSFFRDSYSAYALASGENLSRLKANLSGGRYSPTHASKIFLPKPSGVLRPLTLLTTEDQIVYQACANIIAEALYPSTVGRYRRSVFNHLYAGKSSRFFYLKWQDNYSQFGNSVRNLFASGFSYVANFDLASFYDSIDHNVLKYFLAQLRLDPDLIDFIADCLRVWTSSTWSNRSNAIYHNHGIPQGPLSSGIFSEVVLAHLDRVGERGIKTHYLRYVDDIKIMAKAEAHLRQKLIALDLCSKEVGLFPQTAKINIRKILNPEDELKSVSRPPEVSLYVWDNQKSLRKRLLDLSRGGRVRADAATRFKYLLAHAHPYHSLNGRLLEVFEGQAEFAAQISRYFSTYKKIPRKAAQRIVALLTRVELYHSAHAELLRACLSNMPDPERSQMSDFCYRRLFSKSGWSGFLPPQPSYKEALNSWVIKHRKISFTELSAMRDNEVDWWVKKSLFRELDLHQFGKPSYSTFVNESLRIQEDEISQCAVDALITNAIVLQRPITNINLHAKVSLKAAGLISSVGRPPSMVAPVLDYILRRPKSTYDWRKLLGSKHRHAEKMALLVKQKFEVDIDACVVRIDSLCDLIFEVVVARLSPAIGYGYGSVLKSPNPVLRAAIPNTIRGFGELHQLRLKSFTAHPRDLKTGLPTRRLKYSHLYKLRPALMDAISEIERVIVP